MQKIEMKPASEYRRVEYGVLFVSKTLHDMTGKNVHNRHFPHKIEVWLNKNGQDPYGNPTTSELTFLTSAQSIMIANTPVERDPQGPDLVIGEVIELEGFGNFTVTNKSLHDPILVREV